MNNPLVPTPDVTEMRMGLTLRCQKNEYDEDTLVHSVILADENPDSFPPINMVTLPVPESDAAQFVVGQEYQVEVKVSIPDRAFTPFKPIAFGQGLGEAV